MVGAYPYDCEDPDDYALDHIMAHEIRQYDIAVADHLCQKVTQVIESTPEDFYERHADLVDEITKALEDFERAIQQKIRSQE